MLVQNKSLTFAFIFKNTNHSIVPGSTEIQCVFHLSPRAACDTMNTIKPTKGKAVKKLLVSYIVINIPVKGICKWVAVGEEK